MYSLNWVSHHAAIHAMTIIWSDALLPLATELAQWCGHWNHRLMWPRISCYLWVDQLVCDAWDKTVLPSVFCEQHDSTYCTTGVCSTLLAPMSNLSWTVFVLCVWYVRDWDRYYQSVVSCFYTSVRLTDNDYTAKLKIMQIIKTCNLHSLDIHTFLRHMVSPLLK